MSDFPYESIDVDWKRPPIDREILREYTRRSDLRGLWHCLGVLAILGASGTLAYYLFATQRWVLMALALYVHGGLFAFNPQTHEFSHGTVFKTKSLNSFFKRVFGFVHWTSNSALYKMSHNYHHVYTLHRRSEGEEVHPRAQTTETVLRGAVSVLDLTGLVMTLYDQIYFIAKPFLRNSRIGTWRRYVYAQSKPAAQRDVYWTAVSQFLAHVLFAVFAISIGQWFLIVVVSLPAFYGGKWYHTWIHDTMHVGREPEVDDFRACCRSVRLDTFSSFMYWHMEWHVEHHTYAAVPCYRLKALHERTREHWDKPQTLFEAWREMNRHSEKLLVIPSVGEPIAET
jgi:fatty acid desaturase